ncbi:MAG: hypothetical protein Q7T85_08140 [Nitrosomonas sp.]|nr:hypothetical protein [Nitrosomonas sp.]
MLNKKAEDKPEDLSAKAALAQSTSQSGKKDSEFLVEINKSIAKALSASGMSVYTGVLWEELNKVLDLLDIDQIDNKPELIAEWLVVALKNGGDECLVITQALSGSVYRCFDFEEDSEKYEQTKADHKTIIKGVEKILGYLVLSLVNPKDARNLMEWIGNGDLSGMYFELHVRTMGGVELFMSYQQRKKADLKLGSDGKEITGKHLIFVNTTPFQWSIKAKLQDTQLIVWNKFYDDDRTSALSDDEIETLAADILTARVRFRDSANYCIVIDFEDDGDVSYVTQCSTFLSKLKIPMVRYKVNGSDEKAFYGRETNLMSAVKQFLIDFNKCMYL